MLPCFFAPFLYLRLKKLDINQNLHVCMFATCFSPFISELLFRYTQGESFVAGEASLTVKGVILTLGFLMIVAFIAPAILPGAKAWHKGYNLYNGGLAYGILGFLLFNFLYKTMGVAAPKRLIVIWEILPRIWKYLLRSFVHSMYNSRVVSQREKLQRPLGPVS